MRQEDRWWAVLLWLGSTANGRHIRTKVVNLQHTSVKMKIFVVC